MNVGAVVREARKAIGETQEGLGGRARLCRRSVFLLEQNGGRVSSLAAVIPILGLKLAGLPAADTLAVQLLRARTKKKLTQAQLAEASGLSVPTIRGLENGGGSVASLSAVLAVLAPEARRRRHPRATWSHSGDDRFTPPEWLAAVEACFGPISIDPCWHPSSFVRAERVLTHVDDGLASRWSGQLAFVNPPYSNNSAWIRRCADAWAAGEVEVVVALFPARVETAAFHDRILGAADVVLLRGKPRFHNASGERMTNAPFAGMFVIWGASQETVRTFAKQVGGSVVRAM
jgi:DNA-binding XRE family transcriptional regulator